LNPFQWSVRVYYEDTDAGGVVYHTGYIRFMERARTEWLRARGYSQAQLIQNEGLLFSVVNLEINYLKPARLDDLLSVNSTAQVSGGASVYFEQEIYRDADGQPLARARIRVACLDAATLKPKRIPVTLREALI
jgi:acyl-CoA thioester hydrolase